MRARAPWLVGALLVLVVVVWFISTGVGAAGALALTLALSAQTFTGAVIWRWIVRHRARPCEWTEALGMGFALGSSASLISGLLLRPVIPWGWIAPCVVAGAWCLIRLIQRGGSGSAVAVSAPALIGAGAATVLGLGAAAINLARYPLAWDGVWSSYHPDMLFFEALSTSLARYAPWDSIFIPGSWVHYHWFSLAWSGQLATSLDLPPFVGLTRALPLAATIAVAALTAGWTARLTTARWAPALAAILVTAGGFVGAAYGTLLNIDSPSQAMSTVWLLAAAYLLVEYLDGHLVRRALLPIGVMGGIAMGSKISGAAVLIGALAVATVAAWATRQYWARRGIVALVALVTSGVIVYVLFLAGGASSGDLLVFTLQYRASSVQGLDTGAGGVGVVLGTFLLAIAIIPRWAGVVGLWIDRETRWVPIGALSTGLVIAGLAPLAVLSQGVNELWFALAATVPLSVFSTAGLARWWERVANPRALLASAACGVVLLAVVTWVWAQGETGTVSIRAAGPVLALLLAALCALLICLGAKWRSWVAVVMVGCTILVAAGALGRLSPVLGRVGSQSTTDGRTEAATALPPAEVPVGSNDAEPAIDYGNAWSMAEAEAARWLADHTGRSDVIVTDRTHPALVPALTGRRTYVSAEQYMADYSSQQTADAAPVLARIAQRFGVAPTPSDYAEMCAVGVTFGWFTNDGSTPGGRYAQVVFENKAVSIIQLDRSACPST
jgi:hypothetical protein